MIVEEDKLLFVHVIKTAGVSIETQFNQRTHDHTTAMEYQASLGEAEFKDYFSFTVVRNPWDKMVSQYFYNAFNWVPKGTSFKDYVKLFGEGQQITRFCPFHLPNISDENGNILVDYMGRFENLDETMKVVYEAIDKPFKRLPHENMSSRKIDYTEYYDVESQAVIERLFAEEIELFGYEFNK